MYGQTIFERYLASEKERMERESDRTESRRNQATQDLKDFLSMYEDAKGKEVERASQMAALYGKMAGEKGEAKPQYGSKQESQMADVAYKQGQQERALQELMQQQAQAKAEKEAEQQQWQRGMDISKQELEANKFNLGIDKLAQEKALKQAELENALKLRSMPSKSESRYFGLQPKGKSGSSGMSKEQVAEGNLILKQAQFIAKKYEQDLNRVSKRISDIDKTINSAGLSSQVDIQSLKEEKASRQLEAKSIINSAQKELEPYFNELKKYPGMIEGQTQQAETPSVQNIIPQQEKQIEELPSAEDIASQL